MILSRMHMVHIPGLKVAKGGRPDLSYWRHY